MSTTSKKGTKTDAASTREKVEHPAKTFGEPTEVVADGGLSAHQKLRALDTMEQDARQLAVAASEGMAGGEDTNLRGVLEAKRTLDLPSPEVAFTVVRRTLEAELKRTRGSDIQPVINRAIEALHAARAAIAHADDMPAAPPGAPRPGSAEELAEELAKEKLDP